VPALIDGVVNERELFFGDAMLEHQVARVAARRNRGGVAEGSADLDRTKHVGLHRERVRVGAEMHGHVRDPRREACRGHGIDDVAVHDVGAQPPQQARQPEKRGDLPGDRRKREHDVDARHVTRNAERVELCSDSTVASGDDRRDVVPEPLLLAHQRDHPWRSRGRRRDMNDLQRLRGGHRRLRIAACG